MVTPPRGAAAAPVRVLVADDSDLLLGIVATWLEDEGFAVITAATGRQALDAAAVQTPDVVLLDLVMPPPDGFEVCDKLARMPQPPEIILMTGVLDAQHLGRAMDLCVPTLLRKPLEAETVVAAVRAAASRRRSAAPAAAIGQQ
jgi:DNA-binding response OmpR family regulator